MAPVSHAVRALSVVTPGDSANPIRRIAGHGSHGGRRHAARQQPEEVPVAALDRFTCAAIAALEFVGGEVGFEVDTSWHVPFYNSTPRHRMMPCCFAYSDSFMLPI